MGRWKDRVGKVGKVVRVVKVLQYAIWENGTHLLDRRTRLARGARSRWYCGMGEVDGQEGGT